MRCAFGSRAPTRWVANGMTGQFGTPPHGFGRRKEPHRVIIARGDNVRSFTISPWLAGLATGLGLLLALGYVGSTAYLVLRDDLIHSSAQQQAEMQLSYEDRIALLRARIDRLTSENVLERRSLEDRLESVVARQNDLGTRQARVAAVLERAAQTGIKVAVNAPLPRMKPDGPDPDVALGAMMDDTAIGGEPEPLTLLPDLDLRGAQNAVAPETAPAGETQEIGPQANARTTSGQSDTTRLLTSDPNDVMIDSVKNDIVRMDQETHLALDVIAVTAERDASEIKAVADRLGLGLAGVDTSTLPGSDIGGPFVALIDTDFTSRLERAERALATLASIKDAARGIPFRRPVAGAPVSSHFGPRLDPFLGRMAMHTGTDFRAPRGTDIRAPAPGVVIFAGRNGGYGKSVELRHPGGIVTRFAHLSRISVAKGQNVASLDVIGKVGSTGRSTGPHLHYEIRINDRPENPGPFLKAADTLNPLLEN